MLARHEAVLAAPLPATYRKILEAARQKKSTVDRINTVTSMLADRVRYLADWRPVQGGHIPRELAMIADTRFGDCKDFAASTVAILRAMGIKADMAWVQRSVRPVLASHKLPGDHLFNHAILRAVDGGRVYWVDPTNTASFAQGIFDDIIDRPALVLDAKNPSLERIPGAAPAESGFVTVMNVNLADASRQVTVNGELQISGRYATRWTAASLDNSQDSLKFQLVKWAAGGQTPLTWKMADLDLNSRVTRDLSFKFEYVERGNTFRSSAGPAYLLPKMGLIDTMLGNPETRVSDLYLGLPTTHGQVYRLQNIQRVGSESLDCRIDSRWIAAQRSVQEDADGVKLNDLLTVKKGVIAIDELRSREFAKLQGELRRCFGSVAMIYKPKGAQADGRPL
jgi:hypothetical protein